MYHSIGHSFKEEMNMAKQKSGQQSLVIAFCLFLLIGFFLGTNAGVLRSGLSFVMPGAAEPSKDSVSVKELAKMLVNKQFTFINVHTPYEGEIEKTDTFIPYDQVVSNTSSLPKDKNAPIILYCKTGHMSTAALESFRKLGYTNVRQLAGGMDAWKKTGKKLIDLSNLENEVLPQAGIELPIAWGDMGPKLIGSGVIDLAKFKTAVPLTPEQEEILTKGSDKNIRIDRTNAQFIVDVLWALGLSQKSIVYSEGPMGTEYKGTAGNFASTGGWTLASGNAMQYYNRYDFIPLTPDQQRKVSDISKNVFRPCCGNSTNFPDCNHGMAALAIIELMVSRNIDEQMIYRKLLGFNSFWFPDTYTTTAVYYARRGTAWNDVDAKEAIGEKFSSGQGAADIAKKVGPLPWKPVGKASCGA